MNIAMLGSGFIGRFYADSLQGYRSKDKIVSIVKEQANNKREAQEIPGYRGLKELDIIEIYKSKLSIEQLENKFGVARKTIQNIKSLNYSSWATQIIGTYLKLDQPHNVAAIKLATIKLKLKGEF